MVYLEYAIYAERLRHRNSSLAESPKEEEIEKSGRAVWARLFQTIILKFWYASN